MYTEDKSKTNRAYSTIKELQCSPLTVDRPSAIAPPKTIESTNLRYFRRMFTTGSKTSTNEFMINIDEKFKVLQDIIFLHTTIRYDYEEIAPDTLYVYLKGFPVAPARTGTGYDYHFVIPTRSSTQVGDCLVKSYKFPERYSLSIGTQLHLKQFKVQIFYEDRDDGGIFKLYNNIQYLDFEVLFK